jgi:RNA polymerase sigma factor (sigma-70 family)
MSQNTENYTDKQIIEKTLHEDKQFYGLLVNRYKNLVFRVALEKLKDHEAASDALQETFFKAFRNLDRLNNPDSFGSWIYSITINVCRNMERQNKKDMASIDEIDEGMIQTWNENKGLTMNDEKLAVLKGIIDKLPPKHREIIDLRYTEGFSCRKIADFLGISERAVVNRMYYARKLILKMFKKEGLA